MSGPRTGAQGSLKINSERIKIKGGQASGQLLIMRRWFGKGKVLEGGHLLPTGSVRPLECRKGLPHWVRGQPSALSAGGRRLVCPFMEKVL